MANSSLQRLMAFDRQARLDREQSPVFIHRRDRRFALDCHDQNQTPSVDRWLNHLQRVGQPGAANSKSSPTLTPDQRQLLERWRRLQLAFALVGMITGVLTMVGLLYYEGGERINLSFLLAFAALQCLLAIVTLVQSFSHWQPWHWVPKRLGLGSRDSPLTPLMPIMMARVAHTGGLCFGLAGVVTLLLLVTVQDLAFGWSTTLSTSAEGYHRMLSVVAWPWQQLWPTAVPDLSLVEATRFFRAGAGGAQTNPEIWGNWWPFVVMVWLVYVIVPRLAGLALAQIQLPFRSRRALARHPGMVALTYRLETPTVDTGNDHQDAEDSPEQQTQMQCQPLPDSQVLICWAGADIPELPDSLSAGHMLNVSVGGQQSLAEDQQTIERCAELLAKLPRPAVTLVVRAWEPPIAELQDFIELALDRWPEQTRLAILPLAYEPMKMVDPKQLGQWLRFTERLDDQRVCISQAQMQSSEAPDVSREALK